MPAKKKTGFEERLGQVEAMIDRMEDGGLTLEETLGRYEEGMKTLLELEKELAEASQRLTVLRKQTDGQDAEEEMEAEP